MSQWPEDPAQPIIIPVDLLAMPGAEGLPGTGPEGSPLVDPAAGSGPIVPPKPEPEPDRDVTLDLPDRDTDPVEQDIDPTLDVDSPKLGRPLPKSLSEEDVERLLQAPDLDDALELRDRTMLEMLYACGLRVSELTGLQLVQVSLKLQRWRRRRVLLVSNIKLELVGLIHVPIFARWIERVMGIGEGYEGKERCICTGLLVQVVVCPVANEVGGIEVLGDRRAIGLRD